MDDTKTPKDGQRPPCADAAKEAQTMTAWWGDDETRAFAFQQLARIGKALASPKRLVLLNLLSQGEHSVEALAQDAGMSLANTSRHLQILKQARLVDSQRRGTHSFYRVADQNVPAFFACLRALARERLAEFRELLARNPRSADGGDGAPARSPAAAGTATPTHKDAEAPDGAGPEGQGRREAG